MKIGIYGGSFNPIHIGHTSLAQSLVHQGLVDEVWLLVSPLNPLKQNAKGDIASYTHRLRMARIATSGIEGVRVSDFEKRLPVPSYTVHTLEALSKAYPQHQFSLVIGADNWMSFDKWYKAEEIKERYPILVYRRPGYEANDVECVDTPLFDISSTQIRNAISEGASTDGMISDRVREYIDSHHLYS